jgi:hypothetical protein
VTMVGVEFTNGDRVPEGSLQATRDWTRAVTKTMAVSLIPSACHATRKGYERVAAPILFGEATGRRKYGLLAMSSPALTKVK